MANHSSRTNRARFEAEVKGNTYCFSWNPGTCLLTVWKKRSRKKYVATAEALVDAAKGQMMLL